MFGIVGKIGKYLPLIVLAIFALVTIAIVLYMYITSKKSKAEIGKKEEPANPKRLDAEDFVMFEDIVAVTKEIGMLLDRVNKNRFVAYVEVLGMDYITSSPESKLMIQLGMRTLIDKYVANEPTFQIYQNATAINLERQISDTERKLQAFSQKAEDLTYQKEEFLLQVQELKERNEAGILELVPSEEEVLYYANELDRVSRELQAQKLYQLIHGDILKTLKIQAANEAEPRRNKYFVVEWTYDSSQYLSRPLNEEERTMEAMRILYEKVNAYRNVLEQYGMKTKYVSAVEMLQIFRFELHPYTYNHQSITDVFNSSYFKPIMFSKSIEKTKEELRIWQEEEEAENRFEEELFVEEVLQGLSAEEIEALARLEKEGR